MDDSLCNFFLMVLGLFVGYAILDALVSSRRATINFGRHHGTDQRTWDKEQTANVWHEYRSNEPARLGLRGRLWRFWRNNYSQDPPLWPLVQRLQNAWQHRAGPTDPDAGDE